MFKKKTRVQMHLKDQPVPEGEHLLEVDSVGSGGQRRHHDVLGRGREPPVRIERPLIDVEEPHGGISRNDFLGAVAVMHVEVDDRHAAKAVLMDRPQRADGDVVDVAESPGLGPRRMMAGRTHRTEGVADPSLHQGVDRRRHGAGALHGGVESLGTHLGIGFAEGGKRTGIAFGCQTLPFYVGAVMREEHGADGSATAFKTLHALVEPERNQMIFNRIQPLRALRRLGEGIGHVHAVVREPAGRQPLTGNGHIGGKADEWTREISA